jgi:hypothetical protein
MLTFTHEDLYEIPNQRRDLYLKVVDNLSLAHDIAPRLKYLEDHFPTHQIDLAAKWLVQNKLCGTKFINWFKTECHKSDLEMLARLVAVVNNAEVVPVIAGKNFKL